MTNRHSTATAPRVSVTLLLTAILASATTAPAQNVIDRRADTTTVTATTDTVRVVAERFGAHLARSTSAIVRLDRDDLRASPATSIAELVGLLPGVGSFSRDGLGAEPMPLVRGFYGGGETEYLQVLLDGLLLNDIESGRVDWQSVPMSALGSVELLRGGTSPLYGDAAIGGVVRLETAHRRPGLDATVTGGSDATATADASYRGVRDDGSHMLFATWRRTDGFREHAAQQRGSIGGAASWTPTASLLLDLTTLHTLSSAEDPGPIAAERVAADGRTSDPFYRLDESSERRHRLGLRATAALADRLHLTGSVGGELRSGEATRTLHLAPEFADTRRRSLDARGANVSVELAIDSVTGPLASRIIVGGAWSARAMTSRYTAIASGDRASYLAHTVDSVGDADPSTGASRSTTAAYILVEAAPTDWLRLIAGGRSDHVRDVDDRVVEGSPGPTASYDAFSPRVGLNIRYLNFGSTRGHVYANVSRSFKAPTLDQMFDQRPIPVPTPPYSITLSNADLRPQTGTGVEAGIYHDMAVATRAIELRIAASLYRMDMENEIDFDVQTFRYLNIGRSRHDGIEASLSSTILDVVEASVGYAHQAATFRSGPNEGRFLKAVPRHMVDADVATVIDSSWTFGVGMRSMAGMFLDDANTTPLSDYTVLDLRAGYRLGAIGLGLEVLNLLDHRYNSTGFLDPGGSGAAYYYPGAGRRVRVRIDVRP